MRILALSNSHAEGRHLAAGTEYELAEAYGQQLIAIGRAIPAQPAFPLNPRLWQRFTDSAGRSWVYCQPRDSNGTFSADDPLTPQNEAAPGWFRE
jgi:hypothetical protein